MSLLLLLIFAMDGNVCILSTHMWKKGSYCSLWHWFLSKYPESDHQSFQSYVSLPWKLKFHTVHCTGMYQRVIVVWRIVPKHALIWCSMMQNMWYNVKQCYFQMASFKGRKTGSRVLLETNRSSFGSVYTYQMMQLEHLIKATYKRQLQWLYWIICIYDGSWHHYNYG